MIMQALIFFWIVFFGAADEPNKPSAEPPVVEEVIMERTPEIQAP